MKKNPFLTVMIIPHTEDGPKSMKISVRLIRFVSVLLIFGLTSSFVWVYHYTLISDQNEALKIVQSQDRSVIKSYSKDYLELYQDVETLKEKMVSVEQLESRVRKENGFDPTKSYFSSSNKLALEDAAKSKVVISDITINNSKEDINQLQQAVPNKEKSLNELVRLMENRNEVLLSIPSIWPTVGRISSRFGYRRDPFTGILSFHDGLDIANAYGTPIYATADGIVEFAGWNGGYGNQVVINHGNGIETVYGHNSRLVAKKGEFVRKGQLISYMGSTGRSTGPHSHYEIRENGKKVNPLKYLN